MSDIEIDALAAVAEALQGLSPEAANRVINWAVARHGLSEPPGKPSNPPAEKKPSAEKTSSEFASFPDFYDAANPQSEVQRVLVVGYWLQIHEGSSEWAAQPANDLLKNLGHPVSNSTRTLSDLQKAQPRLAMQTSKSGKSKQARKLYKLTVEGIREVQKMLADNGG